MYLYFYAVPIISHVHAYSRFCKHCINICHTWRTTGKTIYTTTCIMTTYFHHRVPHNLMKCLCPFPANHKCNQLFNTPQSSSWTATINIENTCLDDVDTPAKVSLFMLKCLDHTLPSPTISDSLFNKSFSLTLRSLFEPFPPAAMKQGAFPRPQMDTHHFAEGEVDWESEGPGAFSI